MCNYCKIIFEMKKIYFNLLYGTRVEYFLIFFCKLTTIVGNDTYQRQYLSDMSSNWCHFRFMSLPISAGNFSSRLPLRRSLDFMNFLVVYPNHDISFFFLLALRTALGCIVNSLSSILVDKELKFTNKAKL